MIIKVNREDVIVGVSAEPYLIAALERISTLSAQVEAMRKGLRKQGMHSAYCKCWNWEANPTVDSENCDCGLAKLLEGKDGKA